MANDSGPFGFRYVGNLDGGSAAIREYAHAVSDAVALGRGDQVGVTGALDTVAQTAADGPHTGISLAYGAASTAFNVPTIMLQDGTLFEAQEDGNAGTAAEGSIANSVTALAPNATTGLSKEQLSSTTAGTTATQCWRMYAVSPRVGNDGTLSYAKWLVLCNNIMSNQIRGY